MLYFLSHGLPLAASTAKLNPPSSTPHTLFSQLRATLPLTSPFRTNIYSSLPPALPEPNPPLTPSAPSHSPSRHASRRGRKDEPNRLGIDALVSPTSLRQQACGRSDGQRREMGDYPDVIHNEGTKQFQCPPSTKPNPPWQNGVAGPFMPEPQAHSEGVTS